MDNKVFVAMRAVPREIVIAAEAAATVEAVK